jgi:hypothetical protein
MATPTTLGSAQMVVVPPAAPPSSLLEDMATWPLWVFIVGSIGSGCVLGLLLLLFIVVSAKLHKRRRRRQYLQAELKAEAKRAAAAALADGVHDLAQLEVRPAVGRQGPWLRPIHAHTGRARHCHRAKAHQ